MICVSIGNTDFSKAAGIAGHADMIEIRQDLARFSHEEIAKLTGLAKKTIFTCRPGIYGDEERVELYRFALEAGSAYIDTEIENDQDFINRIKKLTLSHGADLVVSYHNYELTPPAEELADILVKCYEKGGDVAKIATMAMQGDDVVRLLELYRKKGRKVVIGMGETGILTRVAALPLGAEFTFASPEDDSGTAPGQLTVKELNDIYNILKINQV
jgi:3-dehydroquinate dehydratase-1